MQATSMMTHPHSPEYSSRSDSMSTALSRILTYVIACLILVSAHRASAFQTSAIEVKVVDAYKSPLPSYHHRGSLYVMGRHHQRYMIQVTNHSAERVEVVLTVDGRDVINGEPGAYRHRGYVVDPYETISVEGFRRSASEVAAFRFTTPGDSYASRRGAGENVGVIGVAAFTERQVHRRIPREPARYRDGYQDDVRAYGSLEASPRGGSAGLADAASAPSPRKRSSSRRVSPRAEMKSEIGTRYGERRHSASQETSFTRDSQRPFATMTITYDSERGLRRRGVISRPLRQSASPFPAQQGYAPPPPGY